MRYRTLGKTGWQVSEVSFGAWALGGDFGAVQDANSVDALHAAVEAGINFFDTADVYGDGRSEKLLAELKAAHPEIRIATKAGRRLSPHVADGYLDLTAFVERSLKNLGVEQLDLLQLHCPPTDVYYRPEVFDGLERLKAAGKIAHYGVSVERVEEALKAITYPGVVSVQIIYNIFRQRPAELFFGEAQKANVGIIARLPLSSGMLSGRMNKTTTFEAVDHRNYNRNGEAFDRGETFSGVDYETGLSAVEALKAVVPAGVPLAQFALAWILAHPAVSCVIPGAKSRQQVTQNAAAAALPPLSESTLGAVKSLYDERIRALVEHRW